MSACKANECSGCEDCRKPNKRRGPATVTATVDICGLDVEITARVYPIIPAKINCSNDDACPEEGGEIEYENAIILLEAIGHIKFDINEYLSLVNAKEAGRIDDKMLEALED